MPRPLPLERACPSISPLRWLALIATSLLIGWGMLRAVSALVEVVRG